MAAERRLDRGAVPFQAEGRLLQELGERLVASHEVALVELVKNAYDADSPSCTIEFDDDENGLIIQDSGNGMTITDFLLRWMRIATSHKIDERESPKYRRPMTGQKGIGRFAVRFLGDHLHLNSIAWDKKRACKTRLVADFDWKKIDRADDLAGARVPYELTEVSREQPSGTTLTVSKLKRDKEFVTGSAFKTLVLNIVSPIAGLERGRFARSRQSSSGRTDPGFSVTLPGGMDRDEEKLNLADQVLGHSWARLIVELKGTELLYAITFGGSKKERTLRLNINSGISKGLFADIRFFPRRAGLFRDIGVNGTKAWSWVRENHGVSVVDHGFRVKPYGYKDDDWLSLDRDAAHNARQWRSTIALANFPMPDEIRARPGENPMLNLPNNFQLVGAVFVESSAGSHASSAEDLTPSMDREGFLKNPAFRTLTDIVRGGLEFLAQEDKKQLQREAEKRAKEVMLKTRKDFMAAVEYIKESPTLTAHDKSRLIEEYTGLAQRLQEVEEYDREARRRLETMSLLGVVSGFLTHEATRIVSSLEEAIEEIRKICTVKPSLRPQLLTIERSYKAFQGHIDYTRMFTDAVQEGLSGPLKAAPQVRYVIEKFGAFAKDRKIAVKCEIDDEVEAPAMPVTVYSGVLLNLYTNALKAIIAQQSPTPHAKIVFRAWNELKWHFVEVMDNGTGIPPHIQQRIWDPLFTTTSRLNNPLGSGMGLGLSLVRHLVKQMGGRIEIVDAPAGFTTCFRVAFARRNHK